MRVRYSFLLVFSLIVLALVATPWMDGYLFKRHYLALLDSTANTGRVNITVSEYRQGWLSSDAKIIVMHPSVASIISNRPDTSNMPLIATFTDHISHGPLVYDQTEGRWRFAMAAVRHNIHFELPNLDAKNNNSTDGIQISTVAGFDGNYTSQINVPALTLTSFGTKIIWRGLKGNFYVTVVNDRAQHIRSNLTIGGFLLQNSEAKTVATKEGTVSYDIKWQPVGLWDGASQLFLPEIAVADAGKPIVTLTAVNLSDMSAQKNNAYDFQVQGSLNKLVAADYSIDQSNITLGVSGLNSQGFANLFKVSRNIRDKLTPEQRDQFIELVPSLFTPTTSLNENMAVNTPYGRLLSDGQISWPVPVKSINDIPVNAKVKMNVRISITLMNKLFQSTSNDGMQKNWDDWIKQGYVLQDKNDYVMSFEYQQGIMKANGIAMK